MNLRKPVLGLSVTGGKLRSVQNSRGEHRRQTWQWHQCKRILYPARMGANNDQNVFIISEGADEVNVKDLHGTLGRRSKGMRLHNVLCRVQFLAIRTGKNKVFDVRAHVGPVVA